MGNLKPRETLYLYLFMVAFSFALFALGVWVGKTYYVDVQAQDTTALAVPSDDEDSSGAEEPELDFYENLVGDDKESSPPADSRAPGEGGETAPPQPPADPAPAAARGEEQAAPAGPDDQEGSTLTTGYTVQIGAVATQADAEQLIRDLDAKGYRGFIVSPDFSQDSLYRIWVGRYADRAQALEMEGRLKGDGFATYVKAARFPDEE